VPLTPQSLILFVIRDHNETSTPLQRLADRITEDMGKIWETVPSRPSHLNGIPITSVFRFEFAGLPHKEFEPEAFVEAGQKLRQRFIDPSDPSFLVRPEFQRRVPADGFIDYARNVWTTISTNREVNIPSQLLVLAEFRCEKLADDALKLIAADIDALLKELQRGQPIDDLARRLSELVATAVSYYEQSARLYQSEVRVARREHLLRELDDRLEEVTGHALRLWARPALGALNSSMRGLLAGEVVDVDTAARIAASLREVARGAQEDQRDMMQQKVLSWATVEASVSAMAEQDGYLLREDSGAVEALRAAILNGRLERLRATQQQEWDQAVERALIGALREAANRALSCEETHCQQDVGRELDTIMKRPDERVWERVRDIRSRIAASHCERMRKCLRAFLPGYRKAAAVAQERLRSVAAGAAYDAARACAQQLERVLKGLFDEGFLFDEDGAMRVWEPKVNVRAERLQALQKALEVLPLFGAARGLRLPKGLNVSLDLVVVCETEDREGTVVAAGAAGADEEEAEEDCVSDEWETGLTMELLTADERRNIEASLKTYADAKMAEALSIQRLQGGQSLSVWLPWILVVLLGLDDVLYLLTSPMFYLGLIVAVWLLYAHYSAHVSIGGLLGAVFRRGVADATKEKRD
jgi:protein SEY1